MPSFVNNSIEHVGRKFFYIEMCEENFFQMKKNKSVRKIPNFYLRENNISIIVLLIFEISIFFHILLCIFFVGNA